MRTIMLAATIEFGRIHSASAHLPSVPQIDYLFQCIRRALKHILLKFKRPNESDRNGAPRYLTLRVRVLGSSSSPVRRTPRDPQLTTQPRMIRESKRQLSKTKR